MATRRCVTFMLAMKRCFMHLGGTRMRRARGSGSTGPAARSAHGEERTTRSDEPETHPFRTADTTLWRCVGSLRTAGGVRHRRSATPALATWWSASPATTAAPVLPRAGAARVDPGRVVRGGSPHRVCARRGGSLRVRGSPRTSLEPSSGRPLQRHGWSAGDRCRGVGRSPSAAWRWRTAVPPR